MTAEERIASLEEQLKQVLAQLRQTQEELAAAYKRIEELEKQKMPPASAKASSRRRHSSNETPGPDSSPKVIAPRKTSETRNPLAPKSRYLIVTTPWRSVLSLPS